MLCLGIETSCDDTSLALVDDGRLLAQSSASQVLVHALFGGVVPEVASREHARLIGPLYDRLLSEAGVAAKDIDAVAVARGPGLLGSLLVGVAFAKALALGLHARLVGVHHLHAHLLAAGLEESLVFPALGLLVSGGHTHLYRMDSPFSFTTLGRTLDDAAGEAFDKAGKMLGLPYPAGRHIDELANEGRADAKRFPRPLLGPDSLDFSFSGLKTAMHTFVVSCADLAVSWNPEDGGLSLPSGPVRALLADICASYRLAIVETLTAKTRRALRQPAQADIKAVLLAGGVAANSLLRTAMADVAQEAEKKFLVPSPSLCTDNGAMVAYLGWLLTTYGFEHDFSLEAIPRGRVIPNDMLRCSVL